MHVIKYYLKLILSSCGLIPKNQYSIKNSLVVYRATANDVDYINAVPDKDDICLLPDKLIINPGKYIVNKTHFDMREEGLYRFILPEKLTVQRIVFEKDVKLLMSSLAWLASHGEKDDKKNFSKLVLQAKKRKLFLTCESICRFAHKILDEHGIKSRIVGSRALDQWNNYDNGHYFIEVYREDLQQWILYDLNNSTCFTHQGKFLSSLDFIENPDMNYQIHSISGNIRAALELKNFKRFNYSFLTEARLATLSQWYSRIMQFIFIENHSLNYTFYDKKPQGTKSSFDNFQYVGPTKFIEMFYRAIT